MNLILVSAESVVQGRVLLAGPPARHVRDVLRSRPGDRLRIGIRGGAMGRARVLSLGHTDRVELAIEHLDDDPPARPGADVVVALPRPPMVRRILERAAEFGVDELVFLRAARVEKSYLDASVLQPTSIDRHLLLGLQQARDTRCPRVEVAPRFRPFVEDVLPRRLEGALGLVLHPGAGPTLAEALAEIPAERRVVMALGPEGGWVPFEVDRFRAAGLHPCTLGPRILRVDVAFTAALAVLQAARCRPPHQGAEP